MGFSTRHLHQSQTSPQSGQTPGSRSLLSLAIVRRYHQGQTFNSQSMLKAICKPFVSSLRGASNSPCTDSGRLNSSAEVLFTFTSFASLLSPYKSFVSGSQVLGVQLLIILTSINERTIKKLVLLSMSPLLVIPIPPRSRRCPATATPSAIANYA